MISIAELVLGTNQTNTPAAAVVAAPQAGTPAAIPGAVVLQNQTAYQQQQAVVAAAIAAQTAARGAQGPAGYMVVQPPPTGPFRAPEPPGSYRPTVQNPGLQNPLQASNPAAPTGYYANQSPGGGYMVVSAPRPAPVPDQPGSYRPTVQNPGLQNPLQPAGHGVASPDSYFEMVSRAIANTPGLSFFYGLGKGAAEKGWAPEITDTMRILPSVIIPGGALISDLSPFIKSRGQAFEARQNATYLSEKAAEAVNRAEQSGMIQGGKWVGSPVQLEQLNQAVDAANRARAIDQSMSARNGPPVMPVTMPLANWATGAGQWITNTGAGFIRAGDTLVPGASLLTHSVVGVGEMYAQTVPFAVMVLPALEWGARNPGALATNIIPGGAAQIAGMVEAARNDPARFAGNIIGMATFGRAAGLGARAAGSIVDVGTVRIPTGISSEGMNTYRILSVKPPWETWGAGGRPLAALATGEEFGRPSLAIGSGAFQERVLGTHVSMIIPLDTEKVVMTPALDVYTRSLVTGARETNPTFYDLYTAYQETASTVKNPITGALFYRPTVREPFGELPTASVGPETMRELIEAGNQYGAVFTGSRANVRVFSAPFARGAEGFGGTMADFDILFPSRNLTGAYRTFESIIGIPGRINEEGFTFSTGQGKFIQAHTTEAFPNVPVDRFNTIKVSAIGDVTVRVPGPTYAISSKISGAMKGSILSYNPEGGLGFTLREGMRAKDWPDLVSTSRGIARDLYNPVLVDIGGILQGAKIGRAAMAERLSDLAEQYALANVPESRAMFREFGQDLLTGINRSPEPIINISPEQALLGTGIGAGAALGFLPPAAAGLVFGSIRINTGEINVGFRGSLEDLAAGTRIREGEPLGYRRAEGTAWSRNMDRLFDMGRQESDITAYGRAGKAAPYSSLGIERLSAGFYPGQVRSETYLSVPRTPLSYTPGVKSPVIPGPGYLETSVYERSPLIEGYPGSPLYSLLTIYSPGNTPPYPPGLPLPPSTPRLPVGWGTTLLPAIAALPPTATPPRGWTPTLDWHFDRKNKRPFRFVELFSFEIPTGESAVPFRFGKGGPMGAIKNPQLKYLEGPATPAKKILYEEAYGLAGMGPLMRLPRVRRIRDTL